ncbi:MAG: hypothetical protein V4458_05980 [Pseudomonadota bacterium]
MNALFICKLAIIFQSWTSEPEPREGFNEMAQRRAWRWWSDAQAMGVVVQ